MIFIFAFAGLVQVVAMAAYSLAGIVQPFCICSLIFFSAPATSPCRGFARPVPGSTQLHQRPA